MSIPCPSCGAALSPKAFDCPACGHPLRKPRRGVFGTLVKWTLILFNIGMLLLVGSYLAEVGAMMDGMSEAEQQGAAIGGTLGVGLLLAFWVMGDVILGLIVMLTRPRR